MHERVIGQDKPCRSWPMPFDERGQPRAANRPIASFLFLVEAGVGKTELAKTIAEVYFGGEAHDSPRHG